MQREDFKAQARLHRALGNEARLMIIQQLRRRERSAGELTRAVGLDQSTVSKHLSILLAAGLVENRKEGNVIHYRLLIPCVLDMFSCTSQVLRGGRKRGREGK
jgi:DNA-binding transcriptional ArsR family regulator